MDSDLAVLTDKGQIFLVGIQKSPQDAEVRGCEKDFIGFDRLSHYDIPEDDRS